MYRKENLDRLVELHNEARTNKWMWKKKKKLFKNVPLMEYAQEWANIMASKNKLYHSDMKNITDMGFIKAAENIAYGQDNTEDVMKSWMKSFGHRKNILNADFTDIGCGMSLSKNGQLYWCVCFGALP